MPNFIDHRAIPDPAGAVTVGPWSLDDGQARSFTGTRRSVKTSPMHSIQVDVRGDQTRDGRVSRFIWVAGAVVTAAEARQLGSALIAAADELDRLEAQR
jgi:hypothetical protein